MPGSRAGDGMMLCVLPRAVPIVEAMAWLCLCDHYLRQRCQRAL